MLTDRQLEEMRLDIKNTKPSSSLQGMFRQHCEDLLGERDDLQSQLEQLRAENEALQEKLKRKSRELISLKGRCHE